MSEPASSPRADEHTIGLTPLQIAVWQHQIREVRNAAYMVFAATSIPAFVLGVAATRIWFGC